MRLNKAKSFGTIYPPLQDPDMDRPARFEQSNRLFDQNGYEIIRGQPGPTADEIAAEHEQAKSAETSDPDTVTAGQLIALASTMPFMRFRSLARDLLGPRCPTTKDGIVKVLGEVPATTQLHKQSAGDPANGDPDDPAQTGEPPAAASVLTPTSAAINLAAWGRGQIDYRFADVRDAIRRHYNRVVTEVPDAVEALIDVGLVPPMEARAV